MAVCSACGKETERTYGGLCVSCLKTASVKRERQREEEEHDISSLPSQEPFRQGEFVGMVRKAYMENRARQEESEASLKSDNARAAFLMNSIASSLGGSNSRKINQAALRSVADTYGEDISTGDLKVCLINDYGKNGNTGEMLANVGGIAVFKEKSFYNDDAYEDDTAWESAED